MCCAWLLKRSKSGAPEFGKRPSSKGRAADPSKIQGTQLESSRRSPIYLVMHFPVMHQQQHALKTLNRPLRQAAVILLASFALIVVSGIMISHITNNRCHLAYGILHSMPLPDLT